MSDHNRPAHAGYFAGSLFGENLLPQPMIVAALGAALRLYPEPSQQQATLRGFLRAATLAGKSEDEALAIIGNIQEESAA